MHEQNESRARVCVCLHQGLMAMVDILKNPFGSWIAASLIASVAV